MSWVYSLSMSDVTWTRGKGRKSSKYYSYHTFHGDEGRFNEIVLVKHFKLLCKKTFYKYRLLVISTAWEVLLLEKDALFELCWSCIAVQRLLYNAARVLWTSNFLWSLNIGDGFVSTSSSVLGVPKGELDIEWFLNSMAEGGCVERCIIYYCWYKRKSQ